MKINRGFTLIETVVYIALLALIMGGAVFTAYSLTEGSARTSAHAIVQEEGSFVLRKLAWALSSASDFSIPNSHELIVTRYDGTTADISLDGTRIIMQAGGADFVPLTTENVSAADLLFTAIPAVGTGPEGVTATFMINGAPFSLTQYL